MRIGGSEACWEILPFSQFCLHIYYEFVLNLSKGNNAWIFKSIQAISRPIKLLNKLLPNNFHSNLYIHYYIIEICHFKLVLVNWLHILFYNIFIYKVQWKKLGIFILFLSLHIKGLHFIKSIAIFILKQILF